MITKIRTLLSLSLLTLLLAGCSTVDSRPSAQLFGTNDQLYGRVGFGLSTKF